MDRCVRPRKEVIGHAVHASGVPKKHHKAKIHVALLMAVEERRTRIRGNEIDFSHAIRGDYDNVLPQTGHRFSVEACYLEGVPVEMNGMVVCALVSHDKAIALAFLQHHSIRLRIRLSVDGPVVEIAVPSKF
jgi:hypothetical protein